MSSSSPEDPQHLAGEEKRPGPRVWGEPEDAVWDGPGLMGGVPRWDGGGLCGQGGGVKVCHQLQLRERALRDRDNQKLLKVLRHYHRRGELLSFLEKPLVEPTNNRVERALRPAVIARKVSQCSKNEAGAYAFSAFKSVIQTLVKQGAGSLVEALCVLFCSPKASLVPG